MPGNGVLHYFCRNVLTVFYVFFLAWNPTYMHNYSQKEMEVKFPTFADMFHELAKPGVHHEQEEHHEERKYDREYQFFRRLFGKQRHDGDRFFLL